MGFECHTLALVGSISSSEFVKEPMLWKRSTKMSAGLRGMIMDASGTVNGICRGWYIAYSSSVRASILGPCLVDQLKKAKISHTPPEFSLSMLLNYLLSIVFVRDALLLGSGVYGSVREREKRVQGPGWSESSSYNFILVSNWTGLLPNANGLLPLFYQIGKKTHYYLLNC